MSPRWILALTVAVLGTISSPAVARVPRIVGDPVVANPSFNDVPNTMMYTVTVTVDRYADDADHVATVGFTDDFTSCTGSMTDWKWGPAQTFDTTNTRTWTLYNFQPGTTYYYKVRVGGPGSRRSTCGVLETDAAPTPTIPDALADLNLEFHKDASDSYSTQYVIMETGDCSGRPGGDGARDYIVALDAANESIVWYLDLDAMTGIEGALTCGWRYQPGPTATSGRLLVLIGHQYLYEWGFDGTEVRYHDFADAGQCDGVSGSAGPCVHHDVFQSDETGRTHVLATAQSSMDATGTVWETACGTGSRFADDGIVTLASDGAVWSEYFLMTDYGFDPTVDGGPNAAAVAAYPRACDGLTYAFDFEFGAMDWTHVNSVAASSFGPAEVLDISLKEWDAVLRFNASTGTHLWTLASDPAYSDFGSIGIESGIAGPAAFKAQHDAYEVRAYELLMFDNLGATTARVLRFAMTYTTPRAATIDRSWMLVDEVGDPLTCPVEGSGQEVPGTDGERVLANCNDENTVVELSDWTGNTGTAPPLVISLPDTGWCETGGPRSRQNIWGWHRSFPAVSVGAF
jgi:hypothetical protein